MTDVIPLVATFAAGALLGTVFFGALWWTVRGIDQSDRPALRLVTSFLMRFAVMVGGLYVFVRFGGWLHALAGVAGFTTARLVAARCVSPPGRRASS